MSALSRIPGSISRRVILSVVGVAVVTLLAVGLLFYGFLGRYVVERQKDELLSQVEVVAEQVAGIGEAFPTMGMMRSPRGLATLLRVDLQALPAGAGIMVFEGGEVIAAAGPPWVQAVSPEGLYQEAAELVSEGEPGVADLPAPGEGQRLIVAAAEMPQPAPSTPFQEALIAIGLPTEEAVADRWGLFRVLLLSGVIALGIAVAVGLGLGAWLNRPLRRLAAASRGMASGSYTEPIEGDYAGEFYDLASSMETMRREVRRSETSLRAFVASAAHELRTPLTSISGFSQALLDGTAADAVSRQRSAAAIYREAGRLRRLVDALLTLSRYDSREFTPRLVPVDVFDLVTEEVELLQAAGLAEAGFVDTKREGDTVVTSDRDMLRQVIANLLKNAVTYGGGEPVLVEIEGRPETLVLTVSNGGEPLRPEDRERVFERFYRGDASRGSEGFGLGLPLVKEIVEVLGGTVEAGGEGQRTIFRVRLPRSPLVAARSPAEGAAANGA